MDHMKKIDHLVLDGQTLTTFLAVLEETSVSRAAERLGVSQSAVSHTLEKLRKIFDDPLFVRVGRGIEPTARAIALGAPTESVLDGMKSLTSQRHLDPLTEKMEFTVAANDFPTQLIFPKLLKDLSEEGIDLRVRFIPSGIPTAAITLRILQPSSPPLSAPPTLGPASPAPPRSCIGGTSSPPCSACCSPMRCATSVSRCGLVPGC